MYGLTASSLMECCPILPSPILSCSLGINCHPFQDPRCMGNIPELNAMEAQSIPCAVTLCDIIEYMPAYSWPFAVYHRGTALTEAMLPVS